MPSSKPSRQQNNRSRSNPPPPPPKRQSSSGKSSKTRSKSNGRGGDADGDGDGKGRSKSSNNEDALTTYKTQSSRTHESSNRINRSTSSKVRPKESSGSSASVDGRQSRSKSKKLQSQQQQQQQQQHGASDSEISRSRSKPKTKKSPSSSSKQQSKTNTKSSSTTTTSPSKTTSRSSTSAKKPPKNKKKDKKLFADNARKAIPASIRMISGSHDTQTSADVSNISSQFQLPNPAGRSGGACTAALLNVLYHNHKHGTNNTKDEAVSWVDVLHHMREILQSKGFTQLPQLTSSRMIDVQHDHFVITPDDGSFQPTKNTQRAVLIGINYTGQSGQLSGCHNDVHNIAKYLMDVQGFRKENVTILLDDGVHKSPTKSAILSAYKRLVKESKNGDVVFCHYSGHGGRVRDENGDEEDGYDETLIPLDFKQSGHIRDDDLLRILIHPMPAGVTMTCLMDCCHSGTVLDLPYRFVADDDCEEMVINDRVNFSDAIWSGMGLALGMVAGTAVAAAVASGATAAAAEVAKAASVPPEMMILGGGPNAIHEYSDSDCCVIL